MFRKSLKSAVFVASVALLAVSPVVNPKPAQAYSILGGFSGLGLLGGSFADVRDAQIKQLAIAGATAATLLAFDAIFSSTFGIPSLFEEFGGATRSNRGLFDLALGYAGDDSAEALAYARRGDKAPMITKALKPVVPTFANWSGVYVGAHAGLGLGVSGWRDSFGDIAGVVGDRLPVKTSGFVGGVQAGVNFQSDRWVYGLEGTFSGSTVEGRTIRALPPAVGTFRSEVNWLATATARVGYTLPISLLYVKGGAAFAEFKNDFRLDGAVGPFIFPGQTSTKTGWTVGAGVERAIGANWSVKGEWNYHDFGRMRYTSGLPAFGPARVDIDQTIHTVTVGVNYRFGGGPVVARY